MVMKTHPLDAASPLWGWLFKVRIHYFKSRSVEDIRRHGVASTGVQEVDDDIQNHYQTTMITIPQMVDYFRNNVPMFVPDKADTKIIYEMISKHIHLWTDHLRKGINIGDAPIEDLIDMDTFASAVYEHAKYAFSKERLDSLFIQGMSSGTSLNGSNFFNHMRMGNPNNPNRMYAQEAVNAPPEDRASLAQYFRDKLVGLRRYN